MYKIQNKYILNRNKNQTEYLENKNTYLQKNIIKFQKIGK